MFPSRSSQSNTPATVVPSQSLDELIGNLTRFGLPSLDQRERMFSKEVVWVCSCKLNTQTAGASLTIRSEYNCKSAREAASQCLERVIHSMGG